MKNIIIFHISDFGGHSQAAANLKEAFQYKNPETHVTTINGLGHFYPRGEKVIDYIYRLVIKYCPHIWGKMYDRKRVFKGLAPLQRFINKCVFDKLARIITNYSPNCIVATQAFPCGTVAHFKEKHGLDVPLVAVVTDYHPNRFWIHDKVDRYVVACEEAKIHLIREGVPSEKIKILGIPISVKFLNTYPKEEIAKRMGFSSALQTVLIMGGGFGIGPIEKIAKQLDLLEQDFQIIVVCGRNRKLYSWFQDSKRRFRKNIYPFGYINFIHELMDFSDIIITKAGGITVSEALAKGMPIIVTDSLPGQEERNIRYLSQRGAVIRADGKCNIAVEVKEIFENKKKMYSLKEKAKEISFIDSSLRIVDLISGELE